MVDRPKLNTPPPRPMLTRPTITAPPAYLSAPPTGYFSSGSFLLDQILGGGWALGRISNVVGERSTGKTLLAIEACANFAAQYSAQRIRYNECEFAFDELYAQGMGFPSGVEFTEHDPEAGTPTVEDVWKDLSDFLERMKSGPCLYIFDSLDATSTKAELDRDVGDATYGGEKAKLMGELLRREAGAINRANCHLMVISQLRDRMNNVAFGETKVRSGGKALDFFASQIVWLADVGKIKHKFSGVDRVHGVNVHARNRKCKVGMPYQEVDFPIYFNFGIDDEESLIKFLKTNKLPKSSSLELTLEQATKAVDTLRNERDREGLMEIRRQLRETVAARWAEVEAAMVPPMSKYPRE